MFSEIAGLRGTEVFRAVRRACHVYYFVACSLGGCAPGGFLRKIDILGSVLFRRTVHVLAVITNKTLEQGFTCLPKNVGTASKV
jgi:hypothetical protein